MTTLADRMAIDGDRDIDADDRSARRETMCEERGDRQGQGGW